MAGHPDDHRRGLLTSLFQIVQNTSWGFQPVQNLGSVKAVDPLWLALLRTRCRCSCPRRTCRRPTGSSTTPGPRRRWSASPSTSAGEVLVKNNLAGKEHPAAIAAVMVLCVVRAKWGPERSRTPLGGRPPPLDTRPR